MTHFRLEAVLVPANHGTLADYLKGRACGQKNGTCCHV